MRSVGKSVSFQFFQAFYIQVTRSFFEPGPPVVSATNIYFFASGVLNKIIGLEAPPQINSSPCNIIYLFYIQKVSLSYAFQCKIVFLK